MADAIDYVLDACVLLRFLQDEPGAARVEGVLRSAAAGECHIYLHIINLGEVIYTVTRRLGDQVAAQKRAEMALLPIEVVGWTEPLFWEAVALRGSHAMSYADCFAAALAIDRQATLLTSDPEFHAVASRIRMEPL